jgi:hypothetical protein
MMRSLLVLFLAFSIVLGGCKKEADQIVSKPLDTVKGSAIAASPSPSPTVIQTSTPTPSASPSPVADDEEYVKGAAGAGIDEAGMPIWRRVAIGVVAIGAIAFVIYGIYRLRHRGADDLEEAIVRGAHEAAVAKSLEEKRADLSAHIADQAKKAAAAGAGGK